ncbi:hypothetical protein M419DRAFT_12021 [Trichoderma reesei RUT C-30]|jgi:hypothetical protein|uniref:Uncharacterized protein n=1 Tax=Hypocrea jecorina (strain ATCC 56765 / BCRC 32924 / NRRL 11460 / Rut C-30) TaxID=1344414 RepID=A0A024S175_HYPJR|nr:hypothetical protein M419DRAFT_12021 [Trichoderma reesei RUT C-30]
MPVKYIFTESAPSQTNYFRSGRGGAGNTFRTSALLPSTATSTATTTTTTSSSSAQQPRHLPNQRFFSGIGGAGNVHQADELQSALLNSLETSPPLGNPERGHVGRGGAGNVYGGGRRKTSDAGSSVSSAGSVASSVSEKARAWASRVGGAFARK